MKKGISKQKWQLGLAVLLLTGATQAQDSESSRPYFFSGPCSSQGMWTQQALNLTNRIREVAIQLKNDPNCQATSQAVQKMLAETQDSIRAADLNSNDDPRQTGALLSTLPQEISALRTFMASGTGSKQGVLKTMMNKAIEYSSITAQVQVDKGGSAAPTGSNPGAALLASLGQRVQRSTATGLKTFNGVIDTLGKNMECLTGNQQGQFLAAAASTLASFASSGQDQIGGQLATAVSKVSAMGRELKFSKAFKELNKIEYMNSMSCLMEVTSEAYCSARDGNAIFQEMTKQINKDALAKLKDNGASKNPASPLAGYYILTQQLPLVTNWLQKVQIGVDPKLLTDASFKNQTLEKVNSFYTSVNRLLGLYNERVSFIRRQTDPVAKQNRLIDLVTALNISLTGANDNSSSEFFTAKIRPLDIPFRLLGIPTPQDIYKTTTFNFDIWIQDANNFATIPNSGNPDALADSIGQNLDRIIQDARENSIIYYNQFYIVDKNSIYLDALLGTNYNIKDCLISIDQYLGRLQEKIHRNSSDESYIPSIIETRAKIGRVLQKFSDVRNLTKEIQALPNRALTRSTMEHLTQVHSEFVKEVYDQFEVLLAKSGWLSNRLSKFVYYDYAMMLRGNNDLSPYLNELYYATGFAAYDKMIAMSNGGPANVESDLKAALEANKKNITVLEGLFKDNLVGMIAEQRLIAKQTQGALAECGGMISANFNSLTPTQQIEVKGKVAQCVKKYEITPSKVYWDNHARSFAEGYDAMPGETKNPIVRIPKGIWTSFKGLFLDNLLGPAMGGSQGKYELPGSTKALLNLNKEKISFDDEGGSSKYLTARMCVQALAFNDLSSFWHLCKDTVLESQFTLPLSETQFKDMDKNYFKVNFVEKAYQDIQNPALNLSNRICAYRDFFRRNQVLYLTMGMQKPVSAKEDKEYVPEYTIVDDPPAPVTPAVPQAPQAPAKGGKPQKKN